MAAAEATGAPTQQSWVSWLVQTNDVGELWTRQPTYLVCQAHFVIGGLLTLAHAVKQGGRWPSYWLAIVLHGLCADNIWHFLLSELDNFWHSQAPIMLLGSRLPFHIILLYPAFMYTAATAASRLRLPLIAESALVGLLVVLIDLPYDIVSVKFVHWTWHATDPNIFDRFYHVPWNSLYFHATFTASLHAQFVLFRRWFAPLVPKWQSAGFSTELKASVLSALLGMPGGVIMFQLIYHPLHDILGVHSEVTFGLLASIFFVVVAAAVLDNKPNGKPAGKDADKGASKMDYVMIAFMLVHYLLFIAMAAWGKPENEVSTGFHQTVGPCQETESMSTLFGQTLWKGKYLCIESHGEQYMDLHCVGDRAPANYTSWYTVCGTPIKNRAEYVSVLIAITVVAFPLLAKLMRRTLPADAPATRQKSKHH